MVKQATVSSSNGGADYSPPSKSITTVKKRKTKPKKKPPTTAELSKLVKKTKFVKAFIENGGNATQAYMEAVPVKYDSANASAPLYLKTPDVQLAIKQALKNNGIDYDWVMGVRKEFVQAGKDELELMRKTKNPLFKPRINAKDVSTHLSGIEKTMDKLDGGNSLSPNSNSHYHLHLETKTPGEILSKRQELNEFFTDIIDQ